MVMHTMDSGPNKRCLTNRLWPLPKEKGPSEEWPLKHVALEDLSGAVNCLVMLTRDDNAGGKAG